MFTYVESPTHSLTPSLLLPSLHYPHQQATRLERGVGASSKDEGDNEAANQAAVAQLQMLHQQQLAAAAAAAAASAHSQFVQYA